LGAGVGFFLERQSDLVSLWFPLGFIVQRLVRFDLVLSLSASASVRCSFPVSLGGPCPILYRSSDVGGSATHFGFPSPLPLGSFATGSQPNSVFVSIERVHKYAILTDLRSTLALDLLSVHRCVCMSSVLSCAAKGYGRSSILGIFMSH
jgi:hypothetical protein